ncbi:MAG: amidohydrolase [Oscillospiraceae bacterium]|nr:amidohydrolase [Oscillospiraceae bacterium]
MVIDFHTHCFPAAAAERIMATLSASGDLKPYSAGTESALLHSMDKSGIDRAVILPVATRPEQAHKLNLGIAEQAENVSGNDRLIRFGAMHPLLEQPRQELRFLKEHGIRGIKIHPAFQQTDLTDIRYLRILDAASELGLVVVTHSGEDVSFPEHNYASVAMLLQAVKEVQPTCLVAAHMGGWNAWQQVEADLAGAPLWLDCAFSLGSCVSRSGEPRVKHLSSDDFVRLARKHGTDRVLFATDSPWAPQEDYVNRIADMTFSDSERSAILGGNAAALLEC